MDERVAVVTGANRGLGRAIAVALARTGMRVAATARDPASLSGTVEEIESAGGECWALPCDVDDEDSVSRLAAEVGARAAAHGATVHTVVANAGVAGPTAPLHEVSLAQWRSCLATDLDGVFLTFRAFIPALIESRGGSLIAISSMTGKRPLLGRTPYASAKMGVLGLVRSLATELGPYDVRVNAVCPGAIGGPRIDAVIAQQAVLHGIDESEARAAFTTASPMDRLVSADEVAATCAFLASDAAAGITGEDVNVSAGAVMY
ncbi:MAG: SDR family oxidoreductase [Actinomycetota bacterium]|nr:SDR family oxidoreductase [Actinomycetota bacterium]